MKILKPLDNLENVQNSVFLAGSIEQGKAIDWQKYVTQKLQDTDITVLNPRRDNWDASWSQDKNFSEFNKKYNIPQKENLDELVKELLASD